MWGKHVIIDMSAGDKERVRSAQHIRRFVETLVGRAERPFRMLSLGTVGEAIEPGQAEGEPIPVTLNQRDALAEMLWAGRAVLPVVDAKGAPVGRISVDGLVRRAARPDA